MISVLEIERIEYSKLHIRHITQYPTKKNKFILLTPVNIHLIQVFLGEYGPSGAILARWPSNNVVTNFLSTLSI